MSGARGVRGRGVLLAVATAVVAVAIASGLWGAGAPSDARARRLDQERLDDLRLIAFAIDRHVHDHGALPSSLGQLEERSEWTLRVADPETQAPYGFHAIDDSTYELCARYRFATDKRAELPVERRWVHPAGEYCHRLNIDRDPSENPPFRAAPRASYD
jgi:hypothetical protein